jgi:hypothetical protein
MDFGTGDRWRALTRFETDREPLLGFTRSSPLFARSARSMRPGVHELTLLAMLSAAVKMTPERIAECGATGARMGAQSERAGMIVAALPPRSGEIVCLERPAPSPFVFG